MPSFTASALPASGARLTPALVARIRRDLAARRESIDTLAEQLGVRPRTVECAAYGWTWRSVTDPAPLTPPAPQEAPPPAYARLTAQAVARMRRQYRAGEASFGQLARHYDVGESTIRNAVLGYTWRAVAEPPADRAKTGGWTVISEEEEQEILRRRDAQESFRSIATALGHDVAVIHRAYQRLRLELPPAGLVRR